ncbi:hypothetical protein F4861DRAFT_310664 [Xylaria intraflava]|nr:hypothetical protein F4861DRAFT_310664 [Xylaria intraflava]
MGRCITLFEQISYHSILDRRLKIAQITKPRTMKLGASTVRYHDHGCVRTRFASSRASGTLGWQPIRCLGQSAGLLFFFSSHMFTIWITHVDISRTDAAVGLRQRPGRSPGIYWCQRINNVDGQVSGLMVEQPRNLFEKDPRNGVGSPGRALPSCRGPC